LRHGETNVLSSSFIHVIQGLFSYKNIYIHICMYVASHLSHLLSFIVIGVWKSNVTALVRRVVVLKKMAKMVARYVKRITLTFFLSFLLTSLLSFLFARMELFHQMMLMRYCSCLECTRSIPIIDMNSMNKKRERKNLYYNVSHEF